MTFKFFPLLVLALAGCQQAPKISAAPPKMPAPTPIPAQTTLDLYLARPESASKWTEIRDGEFAPGDGDANLRLVSQTWQGKPWTHRLQIFRPAVAKHPNAAILNISYGSGSFPETFIARQLANATGTTVVNVFNVPNQPLYDRTEDDLIAYTLGQYLETGDETWPLLFPMTKSVTKTMDALQEWSAQSGKITKFIVTGASKRGWTTYLTAASDKRVIGAIPIVYDNLNLPAQIQHQRAIWKSTSPLIAPYAEIGLFDQMGTEKGQKLMTMIDPYAYRAKLTMPKLLINATNDGYWPHDSLKLYRAGLPGETDVFYVPNAPHVMGDKITAVIGCAAAWSNLILDGKAAPHVEMEVSTGEKGRVFFLKTGGAPRMARLWFASAASEDLREATWKSVELQPRDGGYKATLNDAALFAMGKHAAAFGEIEISAQPLPLRLSSGMWTK